MLSLFVGKTIKKSDTEGKAIESSVLRKTCVDNGIQVLKSFSKSKDDIGLVVDSDNTAKKLVEKLRRKFLRRKFYY